MTHREIISEKCIECELCQNECKFLQKYGNPKTIAVNVECNEPLYGRLAFECSLCQLCSAVCPANINPAAMFLEMRREMAARGLVDYKKYARLLAYERIGTSRFFSYYAFPKRCDSIFFPGCALCGSRPDTTIQVFRYMRKLMPRLGIVLDCCTKPSHDLGRFGVFQELFREMNSFLTAHGITKVLVACPSCYTVFRDYGSGLSVKSVYEIMAEVGPGTERSLRSIVTIHDACATRFEPSVQDAVRRLVEGRGLTIEEMSHARRKTYCCGEGGAVRFLSPEFSENWGLLRKQENKERKMVTYCSGCSEMFNGTLPVCHVLDLLFQPHEALAGEIKVYRSPVTYWNRIKLKRYFKKTIDAAVWRERNFKVSGTC